MYKIIKRYYDMGIYKEGEVKKFVTAGKITAAEYKEITGKTYED